MSLPTTVVLARRVVFGACLVFLTCAIYQPLIRRLVDVDARGWPLGAPPPQCRYCGSNATNRIKDEDPMRRCVMCRGEFLPVPPKGW